MAKTQDRTKIRVYVSVTLPGDLVDQLDSNQGIRSRSAYVEDLLREALAARNEQKAGK
jgi:metal-responsive CopG/Arc/MetJ family transcriptional regulator